MAPKVNRRSSVVLAFCQQMKIHLSSLLALSIIATTAYAETGPKANDDNGEHANNSPAENHTSDEFYKKLDFALKLRENDKTKRPLTSIPLCLYFTKNPQLQKELFDQFEKDWPKLLADALKSSGNMHNPKVLPLWDKFTESMLKTETIKRVSEILNKYGYRINSMECEKFSIMKDSSPPTFFGIVTLTLNPHPEPAGTGQPVPAPAQKAK